MLKIIERLSELDIRQLMEVYIESNTRAGKREYAFEPKNLQILYAEQDFYNYLTLYFSAQDSIYAVWEHQGRYVSALRLERCCDGLLITALETAPEARQKGYAKTLVRAVKDWIAQNRPQNLYAHIDRNNHASVCVHETCGFERISQHAEYLDGSVHPESDTYCYYMN